MLWVGRMHGGEVNKGSIVGNSIPNCNTKIGVDTKVSLEAARRATGTAVGKVATQLFKLSR